MAPVRLGREIEEGKRGRAIGDQRLPTSGDGFPGRDLPPVELQHRSATLLGRDGRDRRACDPVPVRHAPALRVRRSRPFMRTV
jgi:hypothetical protein